MVLLVTLLLRESPPGRFDHSEREFIITDDSPCVEPTLVPLGMGYPRLARLADVCPE